MAKHFLHISVFCFLFAYTSLASELSPTLYLSKDSVTFGEHFEVGVSFKHPIATDIAFADSSYKYHKVEFVDRDYFPTLSDSVNSIDSVVYTFRRFQDIDGAKIAIPVYVLSGEDTLTVLSDSVILPPIKRTLAIPDTIIFKPETDYLRPIHQTSTAYWLVVSLIFIVIGFIVFLAFKRPIRKSIALYQVKQRYKTFVMKYNALSQNINQAEEADKLLGLWKQYIEKLEPQNAISSLTTREIAKVYKDTSLINSLKKFDAFIYAGDKHALEEAINLLKHFADERYQNHVKRLKTTSTHKHG